MSKGGAAFLTDKRIKPSTPVTIKIAIPDHSSPLEIQCTARWIAKNREESYRFQVGVSFNTYGDNKKQNRPEILELFTKLEGKYTNSM
jgi:Tfp pilus assembly protein PilZ